MLENNKKSMQVIVNHLKAQGFVFQGSEIYGGLANTWDYGPLGCLLKDNIVKQWKNFFIFSEKNNYLLDSKILMHPNVWVTSGHVVNFNDPLIENKINKKRYRADKLMNEVDTNIIPEQYTFEQMYEYLCTHLKEYDGAKTDWSPIRKFNLMFETQQGVIEDQKSKIYLRPETTQGIMLNFKNIQRTMRSKLPMGIGQIGKSFRNEVTPGNFIFRTREFEQMELEVFCSPEEADKTYQEYLLKAQNFVEFLGMKKANYRLRVHDETELSHYSSGTSDIEYLFPFGWGELLGVANRTNFDLKSHMEATGENLEYQDPITNQKYIPYVIEPSMGLDRLMLALIVDAYDEEIIGENDTRIVMHFDKKIAPYQVAVLPLVKKQSELANKIYQNLISTGISATYDEAGSIGKRYRRQDAIGTLKCITIDYDTENDNNITIRDRDTMEQIRVKIEDLHKYL